MDSDVIAMFLGAKVLPVPKDKDCRSACDSHCEHDCGKTEIQVSMWEAVRRKLKRLGVPRNKKNLEAEGLCLWNMGFRDKPGPFPV